MSHPAEDWVPWRLEFHEQWLCRWLSLAGRQYVEPFFEDTILRCLALPPNGKPWASLSSLDFLIEAATGADTLVPSAFVFHVSRCGSTLLGQLLGLDPRHVVLSEVPLLDQLLRLPLQDSKVETEEAGRWLQAAIALLGRRRFGETRLFIKLDSWHFHYAAQLRRLYPDTPFILLGRTPLEVWRSHKRQPGMQAVPGLLEPELFGMNREASGCHDLDGHLGAVLASYYIHMARLRHDTRNLVLDYRQGAEDMMRQIDIHLGLDMNADMWAAIRERGRFHSKRPYQVFDEAPPADNLPAGLEGAVSAYRALHG